MRPWSAGRLARRHGSGPPGDVQAAMDTLVEAAVRAAVIVAERDARRWFDFAAKVALEEADVGGEALAYTVALEG